MLSSRLSRSLQARAAGRHFVVAQPRQFATSTRCLARKDAQGKDDLKPEPNEYSKSGSDDEAARVEDAAFNPNKTSPEEEHGTAGKEVGEDASNPLDVSPANHEVSKPRAPQEGGHEGSSAQSGQGPSGRERTSGGSGAPKMGGGKSGGGS